MRRAIFEILKMREREREGTGQRKVFGKMKVFFLVVYGAPPVVSIDRVYLSIFHGNNAPAIYPNDKLFVNSLIGSRAAKSRFLLFYRLAAIETFPRTPPRVIFICIRKTKYTRVYICMCSSSTHSQTSRSERELFYRI